MDELTAAQRLYALIDAPRGAVNVTAWPDEKTGFVLKVWLAAGARVPDIPSNFEGFKVQIESRPKFSTGNYRFG